MILAQTAPASSPGGGLNPTMTMLPFYLFIGVIFFVVFIRPQRKRQQEQQRLIQSLKTGDRVVTNSGIHGLISNVKDGTVIVKVADNVKIEFDKAAITAVEKEA